MDVSNKKTRTELKSFFKKNSIPTEGNFADLIDSMVNQKDDSLIKPTNQPLSIVADATKNVLDIYTKIEDRLPTWKIRISDTPEKLGFSLNDKTNQSRLFIHETTGDVTLSKTTIYNNGAIGINADPRQIGNNTLVIRQQATETNRGIKLLGPPSTSGQLWIGSGKTVLESDGAAALHLMTNGTDRLVISSSGNIGIAENNPTHKLHVSSTTGIRQNSLYFSGNKSWSSLSFNAHHDENNKNWVFPEPNITAVTLEMDHSTSLNQARFDIWTTTTQSKMAWALRLRVLGDSGNVGIGTGDPREKLHVAGNVQADGFIRPSFGKADNKGIIFPKDPGGGGSDAAWIQYYPRTGESTTLEIGTSNDADDHIALMPSGNVGIGTTTPEMKLDVRGIIRADKIRLGNKWLLSGIGDAHGNDDWLRVFDVNGNNFHGGLAAGRLWSSSGTLSGSDIKSKKNIHNIKDPLSKILTLQGIQFEWLNSDIDSSLQLGLIAQHVEAVFPEAVKSGPNGLKGVNYSSLIAPLIEAIKEQQLQISELLKDITILKAAK